MKKTWTARSAAFVLSAALAGQTLATGFVPQDVQAAVTPNHASDQSVTYKSDKSSVVSVSKSGKLTAKKKGTAKITISTANGKTAVCKVTVKAAPKKVKVK